MSANSFIKHLIFLAIISASGWMTGAFAQSSVTELNQQLGKHKASVLDMQEELESVQEKIEESHLALDLLRKDLSDRQVQLASSKRALDANPGPNAERVWQNESRRVQMSRLAVEAREATLDRLRSKETELKQQIADTERAITRTETRIRNARQAAASARQQAEADALRQAQEAAAAEERAAQESAARAAQEAAQTRQAEVEAEAARNAAANAPPASPAAQAPDAGRAATASNPGPRGTRNAQDSTRTVMAGEEPIYAGDDGDALYLRSRNISEPILMVEVEPNQFRAETVVSPGKTYFDIGGRRYRGVVTDDGQNRYLFHYDRSNPNNPKLHIFKR